MDAKNPAAAPSLPTPIAIDGPTSRIAMLLLWAVVLLTACATRPGVTTAPDGTLVAMQRGTQLADPTGPLRLQALKDANAYCAARGKPAKVLRSREIPSIGHWPEAEVTFVCE